MRIGASIAMLCAVAACSGDIDGGGGGGGGGADAASGGGGDGALYDSLDPALQDLFDTINAERVNAGVGEVTLSETLICAAARHSDDVGSVGECSHTGTDGSDPGDRVAACGGSGWSGEIIACGQTTARSAVDAWLGSPGHHDIMLDPGQRTIGVGMSNNYWTAIFDR